ncbi:MAG TPA: fimbria/pilus outer membrane usher protein [Ensifer sp.]|nr:fimbria/pilus outer membrane usher protein [Ensifer sp.]
MLGIAFADAASAQDVPADGSLIVTNGSVSQAGRSLYLEVVINGETTGMIGHFQERDGALYAEAKELEDVGLKPPENARGDDGLINLDRIGAVSYEIDEAQQFLRVTADTTARAAKVINLAPDEGDEPSVESGLGAILNYSLFASTNSLTEDDTDLVRGVSGNFDARFFSPYGALSQSFIAGYTDGNVDDFVRLNTTWSYSDPQRLMTYRAGDFISGGLVWTRPVYLGGFQAQRNFSLRPDLVTLPLPSFGGTAAVPSTLEVYTQNVRTYTGDVGTGPFQVVNVPAFEGAGQARVVLKDSLGRETVTTLPFYSSSMLLRQGLFDFSVDIGTPRRNFGVESSDYDGRLFGILSARYGLADWLTIEGHVEAGEDLVNGGGGIAFPVGSFGAASIAIAGSERDGRVGGIVNAALELSLDAWSLYGRFQRRLGDYDDIASVTALVSARDPGGLPILSADVPKAVDQVTLSVPAPLDFSSLSFSYTRREDADGTKTQVIGASYSQQIFESSTFYATAFKSFGDDDSFGLFAGISVPLGNDMTVSSGVEHASDGLNIVADVSKAERQEDGSIGWRMRTSEGKNPNRQANVSYRSPIGRFETSVQQFGGETRATAQLDGAVAVAGGGVFATNRINDAFAVVDVGVPGVEVKHQNRTVGKTNGTGRIIVPDLNSYEPNAVSINPKDLPIDAEIPATREIVVPAARSGVVVEFGIEARPQAALVGFVDDEGQPIEVGLTGQIEGSQAEFFVGYDGESYIHGLKERNTATIRRSDGSTCRAEFAYRPTKGSQTVIRSVPCR